MGMIVIPFIMYFSKPHLNWKELGFRIKDIIGTSIYALKDEDGTILYVGKTEQNKKRFARHIKGNDKTCGSSDIPEDVRKRMTMEILEKCSGKNSSDREAYWFNKLNPIYNRMKLVKYNEEHKKLLEDKKIQKRLLKQPPPKKEKPKTICECGAKLKIGVKEWNLKQHRETSSQHLAWLAKSCITNNQDVPL